MTSLTREAIASVLAERLTYISKDFTGRSLAVVDIGIFPWHGTVEISLLFDDEIDGADLEEIAAWPAYAWSDKQGAEYWQAGAELGTVFQKQYREGVPLDSLLLLVANALTQPGVTKALSEYQLSESFKFQLLNPDTTGGPNYCALQS
ncbi:hypothetical protein L2750_12490 [Shewanella submarina]|uniref:Uncharacterized protein n=1 Tax=Shewanella submarina TaxID=2016376 RepID=A0ABV7GGX1_9GAMM|nr:hypothetical protein [Shewanella submarina]MCL1037968.1 hypothetical protein [Shewanella submarina]